MSHLEVSFSCQTSGRRLELLQPAASWKSWPRPVREAADRMAFLLWHAPLQRQMHTERFTPAKLARILGEPQPWRVRDLVFCEFYSRSGPVFRDGQAGTALMPVRRAFRRYREFMERFLKKRPFGSDGFYIASSVTEKTLVANTEERLRQVLATLEQCRAVLIDSANRQTAQLVSVAILDLRMKLNRVADSELKALCDAILPQDAPAQRSHDPKSRHGQRRRPLLKLVK